MFLRLADNVCCKEAQLSILIASYFLPQANDFEEKIIHNHPKIGQIKDKLYQLGAQYASMTGSGSTVFGIFEKEVFELESIFEGSIIWKGEAGF